MPKTEPTFDRFWRFVHAGKPCWLWMGSRNKDGYGHIGVSRTRRSALAHRVSWEIHFGPIPVGQQVLHTCDNPPCVYPGHLFLGTQLDNIADMKSKGRRKGIYTAPVDYSFRKGERNPAHKLTREQVHEIRLAFEAGTSKRSIAALYDISRPTVTAIVRGETWNDVALHGEKP